MVSVDNRYTRLLTLDLYATRTDDEIPVLPNEPLVRPRQGPKIRQGRSDGRLVLLQELRGDREARARVERARSGSEQGRRLAFLPRLGDGREDRVEGDDLLPQHPFPVVQLLELAAEPLGLLLRLRPVLREVS